MSQLRTIMCWSMAIPTYCWCGCEGFQCSSLARPFLDIRHLDSWVCQKGLDLLWKSGKANDSDLVTAEMPVLPQQHLGMWRRLWHRFLHWETWLTSVDPLWGKPGWITQQLWTGALILAIVSGHGTGSTKRAVPRSLYSEMWSANWWFCIPV